MKNPEGMTWYLCHSFGVFYAQRFLSIIITSLRDLEKILNAVLIRLAAFFLNKRAYLPE
jgi:hypothetical protein